MESNSTPSQYLRNLSERIRKAPVIRSIDQGDCDALDVIAATIEAMTIDDLKGACKLNKQVWIYTVLKAADLSEISKMGKEGWELCSVAVFPSTSWYYFKRPADAE